MLMLIIMLLFLRYAFNNPMGYWNILPISANLEVALVRTFYKLYMIFMATFLVLLIK